MIMNGTNVERPSGRGGSMTSCLLRCGNTGPKEGLQNRNSNEGDESYSKIYEVRRKKEDNYPLPIHVITLQEK